MPVSSLHKSYEFNARDWRRIRDVLAGERAVKTAGTTYLPRLSDQSYNEYQSYLSRALFFNASARTVQGLLGALFRKPILFDVEDGVRQELESISFDGQPFETFAKEVSQELLSMGRYGILVDRPSLSDGKAYMVGYAAEQILNWRFDVRNGRPKLSLVVLSETISEPDNTDFFVTQEKTQHRVLELNEEGIYVQNIYRFNSKGDEELVETYVPTVRGETLSFIPFVFISPVSLSAEICRSPILDLVNVNLSHYRSSADLEHGRHFTALPTPYVTAPSIADADHVEYKIGPSHVWLLEAGGSAGMLEFQGAGLSFLENACREKERMMAVLGARLLEDQKRGVEAAETIRLRQSGESSTLASISETTSKALTRALEYWAYWESINPTNLTIRLNRDFLDAAMNPAQIQALVSAWQAGAISFEALQSNLIQGEILP